MGWQLPLRDSETGEQIGVISAREAVVYKEALVDVTEPVITLSRRGGSPVTITAPTGRVDIEGKSAVLRASEAVPVRIESGGAQGPLWVEAGEVHWQAAQKRVNAVGPVKMKVGKAEITGRDLRSEAQMTQFVLPRDVRVTLEADGEGMFGQPRAAREPIEITCAGELLYDRSTSRATFQDDVRLTQGGRALHCDRLDIQLERGPEGRTRISRASARGREGRGILFTETAADGTVGRRLTGSAADYDAESGLLRVAGPIEAQDPRWRITGEGMVLDPKGRHTTIEGSPALAQGSREQLKAEVIILDESQEPSMLIARGRPAEALRGGNRLTARELHIAQETGALEVPGPGELHWQTRRGFAGATSAAGTAVPPPTAPSETQPQRAIDVAWTESMHFAQGKARFEGSVKAREENTTLSAQRMEILFDEEASAVRKVSAWGAVEIVDPPQVIRSAEFDLDVGSGLMKAVGDEGAPAEVWLDRDVLRAPTVTYEQRTGDIRTDGPGSLLYHSGAGREAVPVEITWLTSMTYRAEPGVAHFQDGVGLVRESLRLTADEMDLYFAEPGEGKGLAGSLGISRAVARGHVVASEPTRDRTIRKAAGDTLTWEAGAATLTLVGEPVMVWQGQNVIKAPRVVLYREKDLVVAEGPGRLIVYNEGVDTEKAPEGSAWQKVAINWQKALRYDTLGREARFEGEVFVKEALRTLYARDILTVYFSQDEKATLLRAVAQGRTLGDVTVTQGPRRGLGTWFEWDATAETVLLRGTPYALLREGPNEIQGQGFRFERGTGALKAEGTTFVDFLQR